VSHLKKVGIVPPTLRWFTTEGVVKLWVGGGIKKIVKKWLIFEIILGFLPSILPKYLHKSLG
jgi:hypothetical protein